MQQKFITVNQLHKITGLSVHTIRNRVNKGIYKTLPRSNKNEKMLIYTDSVFGENTRGEKCLGE